MPTLNPTNSPARLNKQVGASGDECDGYMAALPQAGVNAFSVDASTTPLRFSYAFNYLFGLDIVALDMSVMEFDTSGVSVVPKSATIQLYMTAKSSQHEGGGFVKTVIADASSVAVTDYQTIDLSTPYSDIIEAVGSSNDVWITFTLTAAALSDMASDDTLQLALVSEYIIPDNIATDCTEGADCCYNSSGITKSATFTATGGNQPVLEYVEALVPNKIKILSGKTAILGGQVIIK